MDISKKADRFCKEKSVQYPNIWWCFGTSDEYRILFFDCKWSDSEGASPIWKMNNDGEISVICKNVPFGSYCYYEKIPELDICVDKCLVEEIKSLNHQGIKTIGCCCGHGKLDAYIQVSKNSVKQMYELGYIKKPLNKHGNGKWCFIPKTTFNIEI